MLNEWKQMKKKKKKIYIAVFNSGSELWSRWRRWGRGRGGVGIRTHHHFVFTWLYSRKKSTSTSEALNCVTKTARRLQTERGGWSSTLEKGVFTVGLEVRVASPTKLPNWKLGFYIFQNDLLAKRWMLCFTPRKLQGDRDAISRRKSDSGNPTCHASFLWFEYPDSGRG